MFFWKPTKTLEDSRLQGGFAPIWSLHIFKPICDVTTSIFIAPSHNRSICQDSDKWAQSCLKLLDIFELIPDFGAVTTKMWIAPSHDWPIRQDCSKCALRSLNLLLQSCHHHNLERAPHETTWLPPEQNTAKALPAVAIFASTATAVRWSPSSNPAACRDTAGSTLQSLQTYGFLAMILSQTLWMTGKSTMKPFPLVPPPSRRVPKTSQNCLEPTGCSLPQLAPGYPLVVFPHDQDTSSSKSVSGFLSIDAPWRWLRLTQNFAGCPKETAFKCACDDFLDMFLSQKMKPGLLPMLLVELKAHIAYGEREQNGIEWW